MRNVKAIAIAATVLGAANARAADTWGAGAVTGGGRYAEVNGISLYYEIHGEIHGEIPGEIHGEVRGEVRGSGRPLVLLHGGLGAIEMFGESLGRLAQGRQVIAVDLQGHGRTADVDRPLDHAVMADDVAALIEHLELERADVMGYSLGGVVALQVAIRHPQLVDRLVLASTPFKRDAYYADILAQQAMVNGAAADAMKDMPMYELYARLAPRPQDFPRLLDKLGALMKVDYDLSPQIAGIEARTLVVAGDADIFPPSHAVELFGLLGGGRRDGGWDGSGRPKSRLAIVPGATHYTMFASQELADLAIRFLNER